MILKHKILIFGSSLVGMGVGSLGLGVAHAQTTTPPAAVTTAGHTSASTGAVDSPEVAAAAVESDGPGGHQDANGANVQSGGGHQDANGSDVSTGGGA
ncbi:MAG: hypothetical protein KGQ66_23505 [Acidobacteriota bacterium]|nr:hypothetical protein [Acidobacteriota bacterium]